MTKAVLDMVVDEGPVLWAAVAVFAALFALLLLRRSKRWIPKALAAVAAGGLVGAATVLVLDKVVDAFKIPIPRFAWLWAVLGLAALGLAVASTWGVPRWRRVVAVVAVPVFALVPALGVNAAFGLNKTLGSVLGIPTAEAILLKPPTTATSTPAGPLYQDWTAPADLPSKGTTGTVEIPATVSGFTARPAGLYLPPAAMVAHPPKLPLMVLMMGQPGWPDPKMVSGMLDTFAASHQGLAPIVVVADQIGPDMNDTLCLDSVRYGKVETYINTDVANWARAKLNILPDRAHWALAGYSNGGQCALSFAVKHPQLWGNLLDVSGELYPGAENPADNLANIFAGNQGAYDAQKPLNIMAGKRFDTTAVFTAGAQDSVYAQIAADLAAAATSSGMATTLYLVPGAGHVGPALTDGLAKGFEVLNPVLGLAPR